MQRVNGWVQHYAWGDTEFLPTFLGREPDGRPWAEFWLGTHANGPATLEDGTPLRDVTGELSYLVKVLSAAEPLSLQAHPNADQAAAGHARGVYVDPHPKPELLCALTDFRALCGFRPQDTTVRLLRQLDLADVADLVAATGPAAVLASVCRQEFDAEPVVDACRTSDLEEARLVLELEKRHPEDPSAVAPLLLNLVTLAPGEALRLDAGVLHTYLCGAGIELMGSSDNVVRVGLTAKPTDVEEFLRIVDRTQLEEPRLPQSGRYDLPAAGVALVTVRVGDAHRATGHELAIDLAGNCWYLAPGDVFTAEAPTYVVTAG